MTPLKELMLQLNATDECCNIEAKKTPEIGRSILNTICAFSNETNSTCSHVGLLCALPTNHGTLLTNLGALPTNLGTLPTNHGALPTLIELKQ